MRKLIFIASSIILSSSFSQFVYSKSGDLFINGYVNVKNSVDGYVLTKEMFDTMSKSSIKTSTSWTPKGQPVNFEGVKIKDILKLVEAKGETLRVHALNDYWVDIPVTDVNTYDIILATKMDGKPLQVRDFGPYFVIYPVDSYPTKLNSPIYLSRFIWQVDKITVM